ncbi:MAG: biotin/lipoyl-binding protein [Candidatus Thiodiazotropha sp. (ex Notomyrtea botanica)]|nr:biotin/lipoyl-binding protein [Candidatus Thiodiazotropha sp. (ex Notomyrtea botanica)]
MGKEAIIDCRPADLLPNELDQLRIEIGELAQNDEDVLTFTMFPEVERQFFEQRANDTLVPETLEPLPGGNEQQNSPTEFNIILHGESYHVKITGSGHKAQSERHFYLTVDGVPEEAVVETLDEIMLTGGAEGAIKKGDCQPTPKATKEGDITTSMPGNIIEVLVSEDDIIDVGQPAFITEAMKIETEVQAPIGGRVTGVFIKQGDAVTPGETLVEIELE